MERVNIVMFNTGKKDRGQPIHDENILIINDPDYINAVFRLNKDYENVNIDYIIGIKLKCENGKHEVYYIDSNQCTGRSMMGSTEIARILEENNSELFYERDIMDHLVNCYPS